jgi:hypothetical protein
MCGGVGGRRPRFFSWVLGRALLGGNCGTAIGMGSGWTGDVLRCWSWRSGGEKEVGAGAQVRSAEQAGGPHFYLGWGWGLWSLAETWKLRTGAPESAYGPRIAGMGVLVLA